MLPLLLAGCATDYYTYQGQDAVQEGFGGTKTVEKGIDIWTNGLPPCKFKILGYINTNRRQNPIEMMSLKGDIAETVKKNGGDAAVFIKEESQYAGTAYSGYADTNAQATVQGQNIQGTAQTYAYGQSAPQYNYAARLAVVKYLTKLK